MAVGSPTGVDLESDWGRSGFLMYRMGHYVSTHVVTYQGRAAVALREVEAVTVHCMALSQVETETSLQDGVTQKPPLYVRYECNMC